MGLSRSTYYAAREAAPAEAVLVAELREITDAFECYGYRRVGAELRHRGQVVNAKKVRRLMRENDLNPRKRRGFAHTTDSDHDGPVFPFVARNLAVDGPDQLWVGDITYVAIAQGFVYLSVILDAWSRRVIGYALARDLEARHSVAALNGRSRSAARRRAASSTPTAACRADSTRSSQHPDEGGCDDDGEAALGPIGTEGPALAGPAARGASRTPAGVLVGDRGRALERRRRGGCRSIASRGSQVVPGGRRHATIASCTLCEAAVGAVPVVRRAGGDRAFLRTRARRA